MQHADIPFNQNKTRTADIQKKVLQLAIIEVPIYPASVLILWINLSVNNRWEPHIATKLTNFCPIAAVFL